MMRCITRSSWAERTASLPSTLRPDASSRKRPTRRTSINAIWIRSVICSRARDAERSQSCVCTATPHRRWSRRLPPNIRYIRWRSIRRPGIFGRSGRAQTVRVTSCRGSVSRHEIFRGARTARAASPGHAGTRCGYYVALIGGDTFGIADDDAWYCTPGSTRQYCSHSNDPGYVAHLVPGANLATQLAAKGLTASRRWNAARSYARDDKMLDFCFGELVKLGIADTLLEIRTRELHVFGRRVLAPADGLTFERLFHLSRRAGCDGERWDV